MDLVCYKCYQGAGNFIPPNGCCFWLLSLLWMEKRASERLILGGEFGEEVAAVIDSWTGTMKKRSLLLLQ